MVPIKSAFAELLRQQGWRTEVALWPRKAGPGAFDAGKGDAAVTVVEWETGNISSSHRALAKMTMALEEGRAAQGILVLPTRELYRYLTDRIGNWSELEPYRAHYSRRDIPGRLMALLVEYDRVDPAVPLISKGTDGRAVR